MTRYFMRLPNDWKWESRSRWSRHAESAHDAAAHAYAMHATK
jgi:hypothetical protein